MSSMTLAPRAYEPRRYAAGRRAAARPQAVVRQRAAARPQVVEGHGRVRLTRRGRLVVFLACLALVLGAALFVGANSVATSEGGAEQPTERIVVGTGDTLWDIAAARAESGEIRSMMHDIKQLNALESSMLLAGQELHVPLVAGD